MMFVMVSSINGINIVMDPTLPAPTHEIERDVPVTQWDDYKSCEIPSDRLKKILTDEIHCNPIGIYCM